MTENRPNRNGTGSDIDLFIATCRDLPEPDPDEAPLMAALGDAGLTARLAAWNDPSIDWASAPMTLLRSTWDYHEHRDAFLRWAESASRVTSFWNPFEIVRWNSHKSYLLDLESRGIPVTPTELVRPASDSRSGSEPPTLAAVLDKRGWDEVVVKPAVSAASFGTRHIRPHADDDDAGLEAGQAHLDKLLTAGRDVLVQRYLPSVEGHGERALIWIDGELTHAIRKSPRFEGDDESVSTEAMEISPAEAALAARVLDVLDGEPFYARIDMAPGPGDEGDASAPVLMELELVEPSLFFAQGAEALERVVRGISARVR